MRTVLMRWIQRHASTLGLNANDSYLGTGQISLKDMSPKKSYKKGLTFNQFGHILHSIETEKGNTHDYRSSKQGDHVR
jgi:hypothetical protein